MPARGNKKGKKKSSNNQTSQPSQQPTTVSQPRKKLQPTDTKPLVSIVTPTYNRRKFIPYAIKCFLHQTYPQDLMEWIVIDDGTDPVGDLFEGMENVKYYRYEEKIKLGKKRNIMHEKCSGDIIVYFDDDDYYPPERVSSAVNRLRSSKTAIAAGSSRLLIYYNHIDKIYEFGPYGPNHATAGTFALKKEVLKLTRYNDEADMAEEKEFLKNYTIPFVQLHPEKTILVCSHNENTYDKKKLLNQGPHKFMRETSIKVKNIIKNKELRDFYTQQ